uniref:ATP-binding cassette domain-containing protein n=1 Tax=Yinghuangia sp. YIM S09857 TaxID=3436929 RepID=UPI003F529530
MDASVDKQVAAGTEAAGTEAASTEAAATEAEASGAAAAGPGPADPAPSEGERPDLTKREASVPAARPAADPPPTGETILQVKDLVKHFPLTQGIVFQRQVGAVKAVDGVSFELRGGETLGLVGESGCGKSTVAKLLMNLEKPTAGQVLYKGQDISKLSGRALKAVRRNIQMVFQDPYTSLNPRMTVGDIIGEPFAIHPDVAPKADRRKKVQELLEVVGLNPEHINRYPHQFSGGQRQRIGIA